MESVQGTEGFAKEDLLTKCIIPCMFYMPAEANVCPRALHYEMIRAVVQHSGHERIVDRVDIRHCRWAFVDNGFLLQFLLYLNDTKLNMDIDEPADIANMERLVNTQGVSQRETCYNILGWVYKEQGNTARAMECFKKSTEEKPFHNAAFWHIAFWCMENLIYLP